MSCLAVVKLFTSYLNCNKKIDPHLKLKRTTTPSVGNGREQLEISYISFICHYGTAQWFSHFVKLGQFFINWFCTYLLRNIGIPFLGIYKTEQNKNQRDIPQKGLYMNVCSIFIPNSPKWEQSKCQLIGEWINNLWYIHTVKYYLVIKRTNHW